MQIVIDTAKKHVGSIMTAVIVGTLAAIWATFVRPQLVMASDLASVDDAVKRLEVKVDTTAKLVQDLARGHMASRVDYYEDQIRILEAQRLSRVLTPDESYRLARYRDDLNKLKNYD